MTILLSLLIFLIPSNLFLKFVSPGAYVNGLLVDYLLPKLYLSQVLIIGLLLLWIGLSLNRKKFRFERLRAQLKKIFKTHPVELAVVGLFIARQFFTERPLASLALLFELSLIISLGIFLFHHRALLKRKWFIAAWSVMLCFQSVVGLTQFSTQRSVLPSYEWLGEVRYDHPLLLAKTKWGNEVRVLPYGTTAHPNILAGVLAIGVVIIWITIVERKLYRNQLLMTWLTLSSGLALTALVLAQSLSAIAVLVCSFLIWWLRPLLAQQSKGTLVRLLGCLIVLILIIIPFAVHWSADWKQTDISLTRRDRLTQAAVVMTGAQPIFGVGLNMFTVNLESLNEELGGRGEVVNFTQPVHNVGWLWLTETGGLGVVLLLVLSRRIFNRHLLINLLCIGGCLLPVLTLDHYLLTQQTGLLLTVFFMAVVSTDSAKG